jgi:hypothetical protein
VLFPVFGFDLEELLVTVSLDDLDGSVLRFATTATDGPAFVFVPGDYGMESGDLEFRFDHSLQQLTLNAPLGDAVTAELDPGVEFTGLRLEVQNAGDDTAKVAVQSIVAWRENPRLPESILELEVEVEDPNG